MKAVVNDKNHLTFVSHLSGVTIIESSGCINTLLNCSNSSVDDIVETFKNEIAYSNIH